MDKYHRTILYLLYLCSPQIAECVFRNFRTSIRCGETASCGAVGLVKKILTKTEKRNEKKRREYVLYFLSNVRWPSPGLCCLSQRAAQSSLWAAYSKRVMWFMTWTWRATSTCSFSSPWRHPPATPLCLAWRWMGVQVGYRFCFVSMFLRSL